MDRTTRDRGEPGVRLRFFADPRRAPDAQTPGPPGCRQFQLQRPPPVLTADAASRAPSFQIALRPSRSCRRRRRL
ncbi:DUF6207 family protein [Streptomyces sp. NPDC048200]|uniref:DUF6207 family protein n=1 Tax=Streptomyces sp. NPDC048200 TaxID=3365512 RepID=UPI0037232624